MKIHTIERDNLISRSEALRIARKILADAEKERIEFAENESKRGIRLVEIVDEVIDENTHH